MDYLCSMRRWPTFLALMLSLALAVTAQGMAFARGQAPAEGWMVLCTGHGMVMVFTDAEGRPTSPPQLCVDGTQALLGLDLAAPVIALHPAGDTEIRARFVPVPAARLHLPRLSARDPPRV